jgi:hypothetical protein
MKYKDFFCSVYNKPQMDTSFVSTFNKPFQALLEMEKLAVNDNLLAFVDAEKNVYQYNVETQTWLGGPKPSGAMPSGAMRSESGSKL